MTGLTIALPTPIWDQLTQALTAGAETAGVLTARPVDGPGDTLTLLSRELHWAPEPTYRHRDLDQLVLTSPGWVSALGAAADDHAAAVFIHTHPGGPARLSPRDRTVDGHLAGTFRARTRQGWYVHLVIGGTPQQPHVDGHATHTDGRTLPLRALRVTGRHLGLHLPDTDRPDHDPSDAFDRHHRAFGPPGQRTLRALHAGVVGAGGTGSAVIEQLARLGVGTLTIIDPKTVTAGNVTRVHGSGHADIGRPKVDVAADHVASIGLGTHVTAITHPVTTLAAAQALRHCDILFGCTDDNAGRLVLSRHGYWYLQPLLDLGVVIRATDQYVDGVYGRLTVTGPDTACLLCRDRIDLARAHAEALPADERSRLAHEGYVTGHHDPDPAAVAYTSLVASHAVAEALQRLLGYGPDTPPSEQILYIDRHELRGNDLPPRPGCYCTQPDNLGAGDTTPHLDLAWT